MYSKVIYNIQLYTTIIVQINTDLCVNIAGIESEIPSKLQETIKIVLV